jgi:hypothetical protein
LAEIAIRKGRFFGHTAADGREAAADFRPIAVARSPKALNFFISLLLLGCLSRPSERAKMRPPPTVTSTLAAAGFGSSDPEADGSRSLFFAAIGLLKITSVVQLLIRPD